MIIMINSAEIKIGVRISSAGLNEFELASENSNAITGFRPKFVFDSAHVK